MIKTLSINAQNDIFLDDDGNISISNDLQAILEQCKQVAQVVLGEMIFNVDLGIPFFDTAWAGTPNALQFEAALRQSFMNVNGVLEVVYLEVRQGAPMPANTMYYEATIRTIYGQGVLNG